jgi:hypothetical protein
MKLQLSDTIPLMYMLTTLELERLSKETKVPKALTGTWYSFHNENIMMAVMNITVVCSKDLLRVLGQSHKLLCKRVG